VVKENAIQSKRDLGGGMQSIMELYELDVLDLRALEFDGANSGAPCYREGRVAEKVRCRRSDIAMVLSTSGFARDG